MPSAINGLITAITSVLDGTVAYYFLKAFVDGGVVSSVWLWIYILVNVAGIFSLCTLQNTGEPFTYFAGGVASV